MKVVDFKEKDNLENELKEIVGRVKSLKRDYLAVVEKYEKKDIETFENLVEGLELMDDIIDIISDQIE